MNPRKRALKTAPPVTCIEDLTQQSIPTKLNRMQQTTVPVQTPPAFPRNYRPSEKDVVVNDELQLGHGFNAKFHLLVERSLTWLDSSSKSAGMNISPLKVQLSEAIVRTIHETDGIFLKKGVSGKWEQVNREAARSFVLNSLGHVLCSKRPAISKFTCVAGPIDATHLVRSEAHLDQYLSQILPNLKNPAPRRYEMNQLPARDATELLTRAMQPNHQALSIEHLKPTSSCNTHDAKLQKKENKQVILPHESSAAMQNILEDELQHRRQLVMLALQKHDKLKQSQQRPGCQNESSVSKRKHGNPQTGPAPKSLHRSHLQSTTASDHLHHANIPPSAVAMNPPHFLSSTGSLMEPVLSSGHQDEDSSRNPLSMKFKRPRR